MADAKKNEVEAQAQTPDNFDLTLDEFCTRLSAKDSRVELIAGFHFTEKYAGRVKGAESAYAARYEAFKNQPV